METEQVIKEMEQQESREPTITESNCVENKDSKTDKIPTKNFLKPKLQSKLDFDKIQLRIDNE
ncbi:hypothetical protein HDU92_000711, partial [Lobulomyces angularis]